MEKENLSHKEDNRPNFLKENEVDRGIFIYKEKEYPYTVIRKEVFPSVPGFVGFPSGENLFISEEVPAEYRDLSLLHEVAEFTEFKDVEGRCLKVFQEVEYLAIPEEIKKGHIDFRRKVFNALVEYYEDFDDEVSLEIKQELKLTQEYLNNLEV